MWKFSLPAGWDISAIRMDDDVVIAGGRQSIFALDPSSGSIRWKANEGAAAPSIGATLAYGTNTGAVVARSPSSGAVQWRSERVCHKPPYSSPVGGVDHITVHGTDLIVGCDGGDVIRLDADSGRRLTESHAFTVEQVSEIRNVGTCALAITGWSSGAILRQHMSVLACRDLHVIVPQREDTSIIGSIGDTAILDDTCCMGRPDVYRPATIIRADLRTGKMSPAIDLAPEPNLYPADKRPIGQGAIAFMAGSELYLGVDHALYDFGDARAGLDHFKRLDTNLLDPPAIFAGDRFGMRVDTGGSVRYEVTRLKNARIMPLWSWPDTGMPAAYYPDIAPDVVELASPGSGPHLLRMTDGAQLQVPGSCSLEASSPKIVVAACTTDKLVGNRYLQYLAAFRWRTGLKQ